ncbi:MAG: exodeoxyribonuclease III [Candidatus Sabulitectum sp.]|nr:exodeoxyribonuclease III [Candidatus Sabulitectum sp.]
MELKIATWNVNSVRARIPVITNWIEKEKPDILCMQELKATDKQFPLKEFSALGYHSAVNGQVRWNGVAIISKNPISDIQTDLSGFLPEQSRMISASVYGIKLINVYVPNGGDVDQPRFQEKLSYYEILREYALAFPGPTVILGDFNVAPGPIDTHSPEEQDGMLCYHPLEREQIQKFAEAGFTDVFRQFHPEGQAYSWWDYRAASFRRKRGMRLDLVLADNSAGRMITHCSIDTEPRGWERPSDHTPVVFNIQVSE